MQSVTTLRRAGSPGSCRQHPVLSTTELFGGLGTRRAREGAEVIESDAFRGHRRLAGWSQVSYGLHAPAGCDPLPAWQLVLPVSGRFTHLTAAAALGWWLPPLPAELPVLAAVDRTDPRPRRAGLHVVRTDPLLPPTLCGGLRLDSPEEVLLACARDLGLLDLLVLTDSARRSGADPERLGVVSRSRRKGAPALRRAVALSDARSESPWETVLRLFHVVCEAQVEPQRELYTDAGDFVARADLWVVGTRSIHEYDGGVHLERRQQQADLARARRLSDDGWTRRGYTSHDLVRTPVGILRDLDRALARSHDPSRVRAWHALLSDSLLTPAGAHRLIGRLSRGARR